MKEMDVRKFLSQFSVDELTQRGVLHGSTRLIRNASVFPLIDLMTEHEVTCLQAVERGWFLTSDGEFNNPRSTEAKTGKLQDLGNRGKVFDYQNTSINPHYDGGSGPELGSEEDDPNELKFGLERDLQRALRANIEQLEPGLKITDGGAEKTVESGRIDITAEDAEGRLVIIELKAGKAELAAIGQLLSYMGSENKDPSRPVRGILVANDFHPRLVTAAKAVPNVSLMAYSFQFSFRQRT